MRKKLVWLHSVLLTTFLAALMTACGGSGVDDAPPPPAQTGNTSLFANASLLASATSLETEGVIILDARYTGYANGHIPGAIWANDLLLSIDSDGLPIVADLQQKLGERGIARTDKIVIYDDASCLGAGARLFWMLEYLGCTQVSLLNGGWNQWVIQGRPVQTAIPPARTATTFVAEIKPAINKDKEYILARLGDPTLVIVDLRTPGEYNGTADVPIVPRRGHIKGAINIPFAELYNDDTTVLNCLALKKLLADNGIAATTEVVAYSTVGKRSAFFYFVCRLLGYDYVYDYPGSIEEWGNANPELYLMETN